MAVSSLVESSFLTNSLASKRPQRKPVSAHAVKHHTISCRHEEINDGSSEKQLQRLALVAVAAGVLTMGSVAVDPAFAAKTGGRVGGQAFRSAAPRINNSRTNVFINPPVAPPLVGGYGYGYGVPFYGGWGWSPFSFFAPGPSVAVGVGGGFDLLVLFIFLGTVSALLRRFFGSRRDEDDEDY